MKTPKYVKVNEKKSIIYRKTIHLLFPSLSLSLFRMQLKTCKAPLAREVKLIKLSLSLSAVMEKRS